MKLCSGQIKLNTSSKKLVKDYSGKQMFNKLSWTLRANESFSMTYGT